MRRYKYLIFLVLLAVVFTGCSVSVGTTGDVRGFVYVPKESQMRAASLESEDFVISAQSYAPAGYEPVVTAEVRIGSLKTPTDNDGFFHFPSVSTGSHILTVTHASLRDPIKMTVNVSGGLNWVEDPGRDFLRGGIGYYVVIGVDYPSEDGAKDTSPRADAKAVYKHLFDENQLAGMGRLLIAEKGNNVWGPPTRQNIKRAIDDAIDLARTSNHLDYLVIYFSGDSEINILFDSDEKTITDGELRDWVEGFPGPVTLILDGHYSETFVDDKVLPQAFKEGDYTVLVGTLDGETSGATTGSGLSWFTYNLLEGIRTRAADGGYGNGEITAQELYRYTKWAMGSDQTPFLKEGSYADAVVFRYEK